MADDPGAGRDERRDSRSRPRRDREKAVKKTTFTPEEERRLRCVLFVLGVVEKVAAKTADKAASWVGTLIWSAILTFLLWVLGLAGLGGK